MHRRKDIGLKDAGCRAVVGLLILSIIGAAGCAPQRGAVAKDSFPSLVLPREREIVRPIPEPIEPVRPSPFMPTVYDRREWHARPTRSNHEAMGRITRITIHHAGMGVEEEMPIEDVKARLQTIQRSHQDHRRWADIGYHFIIDCSGNIWEGRPLAYQGAHAGNNSANRGNVGICVMGNYDLQRPTTRQMSAIRWLVADLMKRHSVPISRVYTHREISSLHGLGYTDCPGQHLQREVDAMRTHIAEGGSP